MRTSTAADRQRIMPAKIAKEYWDRLRTSYCANVKLIDDQVGEICKAVSEKYGDNALIIFTADHGEMLGNHGIWGKHNCAYDEVWKIRC